MVQWRVPRAGAQPDFRIGTGSSEIGMEVDSKWLVLKAVLILSSYMPILVQHTILILHGPGGRVTYLDT